MKTLKSLSKEKIIKSNYSLKTSGTNNLTGIACNWVYIDFQYMYNRLKVYANHADEGHLKESLLYLTRFGRNRIFHKTNI